MKSHMPLAGISVFIITSALSVNAVAADETMTNEKNPPSAQSQSKSAKKHSHLAEKGMPQVDRASGPKSDRLNDNARSKDKTRHLHPRDGK